MSANRHTAAIVGAALSVLAVVVGDSPTPRPDARPATAATTATVAPPTRRSAGVKATPTKWDWDRLAQCESGGRWNTNTGNSYYGGLQYSAGTWRAHKPAGYPARADLATREQQIDVGEITYARQGPGAWPACTTKLGWRYSGAAPEPRQPPAPASPAPTQEPTQEPTQGG